LAVFRSLFSEKFSNGNIMTFKHLNMVKLSKQTRELKEALGNALAMV
jgi:hypothetical protein